MKDFLGNELLIDDEVVYVQFNHTSVELRRGTVCGFTPKKVYVTGKYGRILKNAYHVIKICKGDTND